MRVLANTTVLSNFAMLGELDRLRQLFGEVFLSIDVLEEIFQGLEEGYRFYSGIGKLVQPASPRGWLILVSLEGRHEIRAFGEMPSKLHRGEASSLSIARSRGWLFLTDDRAAREQARRLGVELSGTLGCLAEGIRRNLWTTEVADGWLATLREAGFRSPVARLSEL